MLMQLELFQGWTQMDLRIKYMKIATSKPKNSAFKSCFRFWANRIVFIIFAIIFNGSCDVQSDSGWIKSLPLNKAVTGSVAVGVDARYFYIFPENTSVKNIKEKFPNIQTDSIDSFGYVIVFLDEKNQPTARFINTYDNTVQLIVSSELLQRLIPANNVVFKRTVANDKQVIELTEYQP